MQKIFSKDVLEARGEALIRKHVILSGSQVNKVGYHEDKIFIFLLLFFLIFLLWILISALLNM